MHLRKENKAYTKLPYIKNGKLDFEIIRCNFQSLKVCHYSRKLTDL